MAHSCTYPKLITSTFEPLNDLLMDLQKETPVCYREAVKILINNNSSLSWTPSADFFKGQRISHILQDMNRHFEGKKTEVIELATGTPKHTFYTFEGDYKVIFVVTRIAELLGYQVTVDCQKITITWEKTNP